MSQGGVRAPTLQLEKIWFFWRKILIFHTKYPKKFAPPSTRRNFYNCTPPNLKSWIRPCMYPFQCLCLKKKTGIYICLLPFFQMASYYVT